MADRWDWEETSTDWRAAIDRAGHRRRRHRAAESPARPGGDRRRRRPARSSSARSRWRCRSTTRARWSTRHATCRTMVWFNYRRVPAIAFARQLIDDGRLGHDLSLQRGVQAAVGRRTRRGAPPGKWIRRWPARASADDLLTHLLDTALVSQRTHHARRSPTRARICRTVESTTRSWRW